MKYEKSGLPQQSQNLRKAFEKYVTKFAKAQSIDDIIEKTIVPTASILSQYSEDNKCDVLAAYLLSTIREASSNPMTLKDVEEEFNSDIKKLLIQIEIMGNSDEELRFVSPRLKQLFLSQALANIEKLDGSMANLGTGLLAHGQLRIASKKLSENKKIAKRCIPSGLPALDKEWSKVKNEVKILLDAKRKRLYQTSTDAKKSATL